MSDSTATDYLIVGAGIMGLALAREIREREPASFWGPTSGSGTRPSPRSGNIPGASGRLRRWNWSRVSTPPGLPGVRPGIRAQFLDMKSHRLVSDFRVEGDRESLHILNTVSPAFTTSLPFAEWTVERFRKGEGWTP